MTAWSRIPGKTKDLMEKFLAVIKADETVILEFRLEREMLELFATGVLVETVPTGVVRAEMRIICLPSDIEGTS